MMGYYELGVAKRHFHFPTLKELIMIHPRQIFFTAFACLFVTASCEIAKGDLISFGSGDFGVEPVFSNVQTFDFAIDIAVPLTAGTTYTNPTLNGVVYSVSGTLQPMTPSTFSAFALERTIGGGEFYSQGSSLSFTIDAAADLSDGLQLSELAGIDPVFLFNGRELNTGRFHPALFQLNADGSGSIQNSNNVPFGDQIDFGAEYITNLSVDPSSLTLVATVSVPEPGSESLLIAIGGLALSRRRRK